jgi:dipeptidyl aminopeptidase/acylaminoacyl peptidase
VWDLAGVVEPVRIAGEFREVNAVLFSPDGSALLSADWSGAIRVLESATGAEISTILPESGAVRCIAVSPDGKTVAAATTDSRDITLWETSSGSRIRVLKRKKEPVLSLAFSPDGKRLVSGGEDEYVQIWDAETGKSVRKFRGHDGFVLSVTFSPRGTHVLSGGEDGTVRLFELISGKEALCFEGGSPVGSVAFSADGKRAVSGMGDSTALVWDLAPKPKDADPAALWKTLGSSKAGAAHEAMWGLAKPEAIAFLKEKLRPVVHDAAEIDKYLKDLDEGDVEARTKAAAELEWLGPEKALRRALKLGGSAEFRAQVREILRRLEAPEVKSGRMLRFIRALHALERAGGAEARAAVETLAAGAPEARQTREAKAVLDRFK